jgi:subtilisin family serine protease
VKSYQEHLQRCLRRSDLAFESALTNEFIYRPGEFLLHKAGYSADVAAALRCWGAVEAPLPDHLEYPDGYPILRFTVPPEVSVPPVVRWLNEVLDGHEVRVAPNYVFAAELHRVPTPAGPARPAVAELASAATPDGGFVVGVIDTGVVLEGGEPHPYLAGHVSYDPWDQDPLDDDGDGWLDVYDGHGTFVAGRILEQAPGVTVRILRGLHTGMADDLAVAAGIRTLTEQGVKLINLSLSSTADGTQYPLAVAEELENLPPDVVVVASAGNHGRRRPFWPAAFKRVVSVGAVDETAIRPPGDLPPRAPWSNFGWWVDVCASGVDVLGPFCTFDENRSHAGEDGADTFTGWAAWSGTSFAAPKVTGRIAQLAMEEDITPRQAADLVIRDPDLPQIRGLGTYVG